MGSQGVPQLWLLTVWTALYITASFGAKDHAFTIHHEQSMKCLQYDNSRISTVNCSAENEALLWKWVSSHRLFHLRSQMCLGIDLASPQDPLKMVPCNSHLMLWWRCHDGSIYGALKYRLTEKGGTVTANFSSNDTWIRDNTPESVCELPYHVIYTREGNSNGVACEFPFLRNGTWHHDCIKEMNGTKEWCATTSNYDTERKWGFCLKPVNGCGESWTKKHQSCYQFNMDSSLTWKEAYISCQNQGADLLSISSPDELKEIAQTKNLTDLVWIGLNRLDTSGGWQWSDNTPLSFITWDKDISEFSVLDGLSCGALDGNTGSWRNYNCERSFPYICEKTSETKTQTPDSWFFTKTDCELHWMPYNGFCYMLEQPSLWDNATEFCRHRGAELMSIHSLADIEMVVTSFQTENDIWSGLKNDKKPALFKWSDGTETDFTYWDRNEPNVNVIMAPNCVSFSGKSGRWNVRSCNENLKYICKKKGTVNNETKVDVDCQQDKGWRRHGHFCYMVDMNEVLFEAKCNLTVTNKFEQEFLNSLILEQSKTEGKYFWTSLRDVNYTGDYWWETTKGTMDMTYANWNTLQPAFPGGCVAMASGPSIGKWEVKDCSTFKAKAIYKKRIGSSEPEEPVLPTPKGQCPDGWHPTQHYCYKLFHYERLLRTRTWEEAEGFCEELGGHLVSFTHNDEQEELYMYLKSVISNVRWLWSGLNKRDPGLHGSWQWSDERPVSSVYVPSDSQEDLRDCVAFRFNQLDPFPWGHWEGPWGMPLSRPWRLWHKPEVLISLKPFHCEASLEWMCQVAKGEFKKPAWYQPDNSSSANSLIIDSDEFWFVSDKQLTYSEAALYCAAMDSDLASVKSPHALRTIQNHLKKAQNFTALTKWWLKSIDYGDTFQTHGPHYYSRSFRHCMEISGYFWFTGYGRENNCNERLPFICQKQNLTLLEKDSQKPTQFKGECPKNWTSFGDKCFLILPKPKYVSFQMAKEECSTYGGVLPVIANQLQQDYITTLLPELQSKLWIGLTSVNQSIPKWVDGRSYLYENFHPLLMGRMRSNPVNLFFDADSHCFFIQNDPRLAAFGTWDITSCDDQQFVSICQKDKAMNGNNTQSISSEDLEFKDHKYKIIQRNVTWYSALLECNNHSMELASITEKYQLAYLSVQVSSLDHPMWIGLTSSNDGVNYQWQDGKQVVLSKWSEDEEEEEQCVYIDTDGFWKTMSCDAELPGAFCHFVKEDPKKKQLDNTQACPHKIGEKPWIPFRNNCYSFILKHDRWNQNRNEDERFHCKMLNPDSNILSIKDEDEKEFIIKELIPYSDYVQWVSLGMHYNAKERKFQWDDKTFVTYSNWRWGREATNHSFLAVMAKDGYWDIFKSNMGVEPLFFFKHKTALVCKLELDRLENTSYQAPSMSYQNTQYHIIEKKVNWHEAIKECRKMGSHLASVHSMDQEDFLQEIVKHDGFPLWIGLSSQEVHTSSYEWSDGNSYDYFPVGYEVPRIIGNCGFLDTKGFWNLKNCMEPLNGAICYSSSTMKSKADYALCTDTPGEGVWVRKNNFCYGFDESLYNYSVFSSERASSICHNLDPTSEVLSITDVEENEFVSQYLKSNAFITNKVWLGLDPLSFSKELKWLDGTSIQYTNWGIEDETAKHHCAIFYPDTGVWHKVSCVTGHARVVCKAPLKSVKTGVAIGFAVFIIVLLLIGLVVYFYKTQRPYFSSTVRYQRTDDETETMVVNSLD